MTTTDPDLADLLSWTSPDEFVAHVAGPDVRLEVVAGARGGFDVALILDRGYSNFADAHAVAEWPAVSSRSCRTPEEAAQLYAAAVATARARIAFHEAGGTRLWPSTAARGFGT